MRVVRMLGWIDLRADLSKGRDMQGFYMTAAALQAELPGRVVSGLIAGHVFMGKEKGGFGEEMREDAVGHCYGLLDLGIPIRLRCGVAEDARPFCRADGQDQAAGDD